MMKMKILLMLLLLSSGCSTQDNLEFAWLDSLNSMTFFDSSGKQIVIEKNGDVLVPMNTDGYYTFVFSEARSSTEAYYREKGKSGYTGLKIQDEGLHQVGTKADTTSGASLSSKKDFVWFSKIIKTLGIVKKQEN